MAGERSKLVHGLAYAGFVAAALLFGTHGRQHLAEFKVFMVQQAMRAEGDVKAELDVNVVWQQIIDLFKLGVFGKGEEACRFFKAIGKEVGAPPGAPNQWGWVSYTLYFDYNAIIEVLKERAARQRDSIVLNRNDWRDQLSKHAYWIMWEHSGGHRQRFGTSKAPTRCWAIDVDKHPMGYQAVSDEDWNTSRVDGTGVDPRKGDLFVIIHGIEPKEKV